MKHVPITVTRASDSIDPALLAKAREDYAMHRGVSHAVVGPWLLTWGKPGSISFAEWLNGEDG